MSCPPISFTYMPDCKRLADLLEALPLNKSAWTKVLSVGVSSQVVAKLYFRDGKTSTGYPGRTEFEKLWPQLTQVDIDYFFTPGNPDIRQWSYLELEIDKKVACLHCHGEYSRCERYFNPCIHRLGLEKSPAQLRKEQFERAKTVLEPELFEHIKGSLEQGNFSVSLSAAVVFVEDRLRQKVGATGVGLSGGVNPLGNLLAADTSSTPLGFANDASEKALLMLRGWIGYVRNLHGHQATVNWTDAEAFQQLQGVNYMFWVINNSTA